MKNQLMCGDIVILKTNKTVPFYYVIQICSFLHSFCFSHHSSCKKKKKKKREVEDNQTNIFFQPYLKCSYSLYFHSIRCMEGLHETERQWTPSQTDPRWHHPLCPAPRYHGGAGDGMLWHHQEHHHVFPIKQSNRVRNEWCWCRQASVVRIDAIIVNTKY